MKKKPENAAENPGVKSDETAPRLPDGTCEACGHEWGPWHLRAPAGHPPLSCITCGKPVYECQGWWWERNGDAQTAEHVECARTKPITLPMVTPLGNAGDLLAQTCAGKPEVLPPSDETSVDPCPGCGQPILSRRWYPPVDRFDLSHPSPACQGFKDFLARVPPPDEISVDVDDESRRKRAEERARANWPTSLFGMTYDQFRARVLEIHRRRRPS